jgi:hypothetical protein
MAEESFDARLVAAMGDMSNPTRSSVATVPTRGGSKYTYKYETLEQVLAIVKPALQAHGIGMSQGSAWSDVAGTYVLQTKVFDETESRILDERPLCATTDAQAYGGFETYMRRYALRSAFGLCGEDDDGASTKRNPQPKVKGNPKPTLNQQNNNRRQAWIDRLRQLEQERVSQGLDPDELRQRMFGDLSVDDMDIDDMKRYGAALNGMEA